MNLSDLDREDIIAMLKGLAIHSGRQEILFLHKAGIYRQTGWAWNDHFSSRMTTAELLELYFTLKAIER